MRYVGFRHLQRSIQLCAQRAHELDADCQMYCKRGTGERLIKIQIVANAKTSYKKLLSEVDPLDI